MNRKKSVIILCAVFAIVMIGAVAAYNILGDFTKGAELSETKSEENLAPDFEMTDYEGNVVRLSDFYGKPTVLNFWATWCSPCRSEMPVFNEVFKDYRDSINFVMVNQADGYNGETVEKAYGFIKEAGYEFPVYYDTKQDGAIKYTINSIPRTFFINSEGVLVAKATGAVDRETLEKGIKMMLGN